MNCPKCGAQISQNDAFCLNCGTKIEKVATTMPNTVEEPVVSTPVQEINSQPTATLGVEAVSNPVTAVPTVQLTEQVPNVVSSPAVEYTKNEFNQNNNTNKTNTPNKKNLMFIGLGVIGVAIIIAVAMIVLNLFGGISKSSKEITFGKDKIITPASINKKIVAEEVEKCGKYCVELKYNNKLYNDEIQDKYAQEILSQGYQIAGMDMSSDYNSYSLTLAKKSKDNNKYLSIKLSVSEKDKNMTTIRYSKKSGKMPSYEYEIPTDEDVEGALEGTYKIGDTCGSLEFQFSKDGSFYSATSPCDVNGTYSSSSGTYSYNESDDTYTLKSDFDDPDRIMTIVDDNSVKIDGVTYTKE